MAQKPTGFSGPLPGQDTTQVKWTPPRGQTRASGAQEPPVLSSGRIGLDPWDRPKIGAPSGLLPGGFVFRVWNPWDEVWMDVSYDQMVEAGEMPEGLTYENYFDFIPEYTVDGPGGSGRGSTGSGATGPTYVKPDERLVRESVKSSMAALAGKVDPTMLEELVGTYMNEHKRSFDVRETEQVDPMESVKEKIRATSEYKAIHTLRPESTDEYAWVSSRQGALKRAGVTDLMSETLGIAQATAGSNDEETEMAGNVATFNASGEQLAELRNRIRTATYGAIQLA